MRAETRKKKAKAATISERIVDNLIANGIDFVTSLPCKLLGGVIDVLDNDERIHHVPANKEDEGMGLCAGTFMDGKRPCIIMQNTTLGVTINTLVTLTQFYQFPPVHADQLPRRIG